MAEGLLAPPQLPAAWIDRSGHPSMQYYQWTLSVYTFTNTLDTRLTTDEGTITTMQKQIAYLLAEVGLLQNALLSISAITAPTGGATVDTQARTAINAIIADAANV